ncbi:hypothetical protein J2S74_002922 [Evansella vedderi]|uniref:Uncharacterized protein n=1 Tax=Evansella vedderi TaxID=38282 RepID=A0ABT9ZWD6_9BACI|nr:hypothetical protein [Evansella vedderi]MDQ0255540.1 hypothetical protein [Evansella vedderi]
MKTTNYFRNLTEEELMNIRGGIEVKEAELKEEKVELNSSPQVRIDTSDFKAE